jgi:2-keto-4-pentenoate hydratase
VTPDLDQLARRQLADYDAACPGLLFAEPESDLTVPEAYELQFKVASLRQLRGESVGGYKVGCVSPAVQKQLGLNQPLFGHIFDSEVYRSDVSLDHNRFHQLAIEGEFAFRMAEDVPDAEWLAANAQHAIEAAFAVIELHNFCCRAPAAKRAQELIANNGMQAGVVLPEEEGRFHGTDELLDEKISVLRNGVVLGAETGRALPAGPLASLIFLVEQLGKVGKFLCRGQIVLAGSPLPLYRAEPGDRFEVNCDRLPRVRSRIL